jgi:hypothetical protein
MGGKKKAPPKKGGGAGNADDEERLRGFVNALFKNYEKNAKMFDVPRNKHVMKPYLEDFVEDDKTAPDKIHIWYDNMEDSSGKNPPLGWKGCTALCDALMKTEYPYLDSLRMFMCDI